MYLVTGKVRVVGNLGGVGHQSWCGARCGCAGRGWRWPGEGGLQSCVVRTELGKALHDSYRFNLLVTAR